MVSTNPNCCFADSWKESWVYSAKEGKEFGKFVRTAGKFYNDEAADQGKCRPVHWSRSFNYLGE